MTDATPPLNTHGGRRPGAGAPRGNINALRSGIYSTRSDAFLLIGSVEALEDRYIARSKPRSQEDRRHQAQLLRAAQWVIRHPNHFANELEALIYFHLIPRWRSVHHGPMIMQQLTRPRDRGRPVHGALVIANYLRFHDPYLAPILAAFITERVEAALARENSAENNQTIKFEDPPRPPIPPRRRPRRKRRTTITAPSPSDAAS